MQMTQQTLTGATILLRYSRGTGAPLATAVEHWRRAGADVPELSVRLATCFLLKAARWLRLPPTTEWRAFEWQASAGAALIALDVQMHGVGIQAHGRSGAPALRLLPGVDGVPPASGVLDAPVRGAS